MLRWLCCPAPCYTASEPSAGNGGSGAPVKASMSGGAMPQPGWNRGIHLYPTPDLSGGGYFLYLSPNQKGGKENVRRNPVYL